MTSSTIYKAFKFRLYPTEEQEVFFEKTAGCCRFVYNKLLEASIAEYEKTGNFIFGHSLTNLLPKLKQEYNFLKEVDSQSLQQSARHLGQAFKNRFSKKNNKASGFPKFKSKHSSRQSFTATQAVKIPKINWISCKMHRKLEGKVKSLTISKDVDVWYVSILCELPEKEIHYDPSNSVGIDLGIKTFAVTSDGECIDAPNLSKEYKKLKTLQRRQARKQKGSSNRNKARIKVAKQYRKIRRINKNFIETTSSAIAKLYDVVSVEDLNITGMKKNRRLAPSIQKLSWYGFIQALSRKVPVIHKVHRFYPSSKTCSCCGWIKKDLTLGDRIFSCYSCGNEIDRDVNAAINIYNNYYRTGAAPRFACGGVVRPKGFVESDRQTPVKQEYEFTGTQTINGLHDRC